MITQPMPFAEAIRYLLDKEQLPAEWDAATWREQEADFRTQAFFSSRVESARFLDRAQTLLFDYLTKVRETVVGPDGVERTALSVSDRSHFVERMRRFMIEEGMAKPEDFKDVDQKDITDIRSLARLDLIFDTTVRQSYGFGQWKQGMEPAVLRAFPAARLIRDRGVKEPRPRHQANLGEVLLKTDPRWAEYHNAREIGGFGVPWGPYGFNSGVTQEDVSRKEAKALGLPVDTAAKGMDKTPPITTGTQASTKKMDPELKKKLIRELRNGPKPRSPEEAAREAAANARRSSLNRGLEEAEQRGDAAKAEKYRKALAKLPSAGMDVIDDGDSIRLAEDLGERVSKARKSTPDGTPEQERAIADAIFDRIDRKTAEPQRSAEGGKGLNRARHLFRDDLVLTPEERQLLESPHEILVIYTPEGRLKKAVMGGRKAVTIPDNLESGSVLSHNHPGGTGASALDLKYVLANPGQTLRIATVSEEGTELYQLRALQPVPEDMIAAIVAEYEAAATAGGDTRSARLDALALILNRYGDTLAAELAVFR